MLTYDLHLIVSLEDVRVVCLFRKAKEPIHRIRCHFPEHIRLFSGLRRQDLRA